MLVRISDFSEFQNDWAHSAHIGQIQLFDLSFSLTQRVQNFVPQIKLSNSIFYFRKQTKLEQMNGDFFHSFFTVAGDVLYFTVLTYLNTELLLLALLSEFRVWWLFLIPIYQTDPTLLFEKKIELSFSASK